MGASAPYIRSERVAEIIASSSAKRTLVLGDMVVDEHIVGEARRMSREAPVPVIEQRERILVPGGATNVAANLKALGCEVAVAGVVGTDPMAVRLTEQLEQREIRTAGLIQDSHRATAVKLRVWAGGDRQRPQSMVARVDVVDRSEIPATTADKLARFIEMALPDLDALIVSDYEAGVVSRDVLGRVLPAAQKAGVLLTADAHGDLGRFAGVSLLTPNQPEAEAELGVEIGSTSDALEAACQLRHKVGVDAVLITLGEAGMVLDARDDGQLSIPTSGLVRIADPTGAGDTVAAAMTTARLGGATFSEAAAVAALAARVVVRQLGAAVVAADEVLKEADDISF